MLEHAAGKYDQVLCCGDLIGYGADPNAVGDWVRDKRHGGGARQSRQSFRRPGRPGMVQSGGARGGHMDATRTDPGEHRIHPRPAAGAADRGWVPDGARLAARRGRIHARSAGDAGQVFGYLATPVAFFGHTHLQGGFIWNHARDRDDRQEPGPTSGETLDIDPDCAYMINPGSVGQPRDADPRAAYVVYNPENIFLIYYRVPYDVAKRRRRSAGRGFRSCWPKTGRWKDPPRRPLSLPIFPSEM